MGAGRIYHQSFPTISGWWFRWFFYDFPFSWEFHHPNWRTPSFFRGVGQPPTRYDRFHFSDDAKASMIPLSHISTYSRNLRHQWGVHQIYIYIYWLKHIKITSIYIYRDDKQLPFSHSFRICSTDFWIVNFGELAAFLCLGGGPGAIPSDASVRNRKKSGGRLRWEPGDPFFRQKWGVSLQKKDHFSWRTVT